MITSHVGRTPLSGLAIRVISLPHCLDRRARMAAQLDPLGFAWSFLDACTGPPADLPYDPARARIVRGRALTPGELGCFASHWSLWQALVADRAHDLMLVLEDDLLLDPVFFASLDRVIAALGDIDYLRLYAKVPAGIRRERPFLDRHVARFGGKAFGTQAYFITRAGAARFLASIERIERPVDDEIDRFWIHGVPVRAVFPFPVMEIDYGTTIEPTRRTLEPLGHLEQARRIAHRAVEKVRRLAARPRIAR